MSGVELRFPPSAGHVRTARLVAAAVARRAGLDEVRLKELRTAVGEACARAVQRCQACAQDAPIVLSIDDSGPGLLIEVSDAAPAPAEDDPVTLAILDGLADVVEVLGRSGSAGGIVRLRWLPPLSGPAPEPEWPGAARG